MHRKIFSTSFQKVFKWFSVCFQIVFKKVSKSHFIVSSKSLQLLSQCATHVVAFGQAVTKFAWIPSRKHEMRHSWNCYNQNEAQMLAPSNLYPMHCKIFPTSFQKVFKSFSACFQIVFKKVSKRFQKSLHCLFKKFAASVSMCNSCCGNWTSRNKICLDPFT